MDKLSVEINVLQGERDFVRANKSMGSFCLHGIPPAPRCVPQIEVKFDINANGILSAAAVHKGTRKNQDIAITGATTSPSDEVDLMVIEAKKIANEDKEKQEGCQLLQTIVVKIPILILGSYDFTITPL